MTSLTSKLSQSARSDLATVTELDAESAFLGVWALASALLSTWPLVVVWAPSSVRLLVVTLVRTQAVL
jgi:hypothetical protein